mmetsp:Transcript_123203/g.359737  ORF Transcript_123203/g.359737 Transcript_123203/m.359737 type:complete len:204 (+) Transcript_123203:1109-1720(+)
MPIITAASLVLPRTGCQAHPERHVQEGQAADADLLRARGLPHRALELGVQLQRRQQVLDLRLKAWTTVREGNRAGQTSGAARVQAVVRRHPLRSQRRDGRLCLDGASLTDAGADDDLRHLADGLLTGVPSSTSDLGPHDASCDLCEALPIVARIICVDRGFVHERAHYMLCSRRKQLRANCLLQSPAIPSWNNLLMGTTTGPR